MRSVPDCLSRRYKALDDLVTELSSALSNKSSNRDNPGPDHDPGIKLMCHFWNILKEDPDCNLPQAVHQRMCMNTKCSNSGIQPQLYGCYMAHECRNYKKDSQKSCCQKPTHEHASGSSTPRVAHTNEANMPLSKVLGELKAIKLKFGQVEVVKVKFVFQKAASFDKKCTVRLNELLVTENQLKVQIQNLETKEREGLVLLKQADCMWSCMEDAYKRKVEESLERQKQILKQLKEVETSAAKWRKNKKELESQLDSINKCQTEITDKINQKKNDIKYMNMEIEGFRKRIETNKKEIAGASSVLANKKKASDAKMASITSKITKLESTLKEEKKHKIERDDEGARYIKEARDELQKICRVLLHKRLENEDKNAEKEGLLLEIDLLKDTCDKCKEKCKNKQLSIGEEINKLDAEIAAFKVRCIRCHECIDTSDVRTFCIDCPKCAQDRECILDGDYCDPDHTFDCICLTIKHKFLDNVFENMYTVLDRQVRTGGGKAVATTVVNCLKKSRNGKLNEETRKILQEFVLSTIKNNLNLTIAGGAVKTRCEMDPEEYKQLMTCLKQVKVTQPPKADKSTTKKDPCKRWAGTSECHCPKGPKACICNTKAPPPPRDPTPCPAPPQDKEDKGEIVQCPHKKDTICGPDCSMQGVPSSGTVGAEVAAWRPDPCQGPSCKFSKNMRAAQCVLGPESLSSLTTQSYKTAAQVLPDISVFEDELNCKCGALTKPCECCKDVKNRPRERIIDEVMGRYTEVAPIEKVSSIKEHGHSESNMRRNKSQRRVDTNISFGKLFSSNTQNNKSSHSSKRVNKENNLHHNNDITLKSSGENLRGSKNIAKRKKETGTITSNDLGNQSTHIVNDRIKVKSLHNECTPSNKIKENVSITGNGLVKYNVSVSVPESGSTDFTNNELKLLIEKLKLQTEMPTLSHSTFNEQELISNYYENKYDETTSNHKNYVNNKHLTINGGTRRKFVFENFNVQRTDTSLESDSKNSSPDSVMQNDSSQYRLILQGPPHTEEGETSKNNSNLNYQYVYQRLKKIQQGRQYYNLLDEDSKISNVGRNGSSDFNYIIERLTRIKESREKVAKQCLN